MISIYAVMFYFANYFFVAACLAVVVGVFNVRLTSFMHDCSHYAYFTSRRANEWVGSLLGILTFTPFLYFKYHHLKHHGASGNLDRRGWGDVLLYTVEEYANLPFGMRVFYRLYRNPWIYFSIGPFVYFLYIMRNPFSAAAGTRERRSLHFVNFIWIGVYAAACAAGADMLHFSVLHMTTLYVGGLIGLWLFYVQHQFETAYWRRSSEWDFADAAWHGSTYLQFPPFVEWLLGSINMHDVHHLDAKVPNYRLRERMRSLPYRFNSRNTFTFADTFKTFRLKLWDEEDGVMVGFPKLSRRTIFRRQSIMPVQHRDEEAVLNSP